MIFFDEYIGAPPTVTGSPAVIFPSAKGKIAQQRGNE